MESYIFYLMNTPISSDVSLLGNGADIYAGNAWKNNVEDAAQSS